MTDKERIEKTMKIYVDEIKNDKEYSLIEYEKNNCDNFITFSDDYNDDYKLEVYSIKGLQNQMVVEALEEVKERLNVETYLHPFTQEPFVTKEIYEEVINQLIIEYGGKDE